MRTAIIVAATAVLLLTPALAAGPATGAGGKKNCTLLRQFAKTTGEQDLYVARDAVKLIVHRIGYTIVMKAPEWDVVLFNDKKKTLCKKKPDQFATGVSTIGSVMRAKFVGGVKVASSKEKIAGLEVQHECFQPPGLPKDSRHWRGRKEWEFLKQDCWNTDEFHLPDSVCRVLHKLTGVPGFSGVPMKFTYIANTCNEWEDFSTSSAKKMSVDSAFFDVPKNYKTVESEQEIMRDSTNDDIFLDLIHR